MLVHAAATENVVPRDASRRVQYLKAAYASVPRLLASIDKNSFGPSYGCCDRQYWHYRTAAFPSEMYQEAALPLAILYSQRLPGNRWYGEARVAEAAVAAIRFSAVAAHKDGSCDDYYPYERALGAAVFSLQAQAAAYRWLGLDDPKLIRFLERRAEWIAANEESGQLANHHALAALALWRTYKLTGSRTLREAALERIERVLAWQSTEGWFNEYGGADPGYQSVTIDALAQLRREAGLTNLDEPLRRAVEFARCFLHPDDGYGGEYGSRGTRHCYPLGWELLATNDANAAELAEGALRSMARGTAACFDDDRMYVHRLASLLEAYQNWSPTKPLRAEVATAAVEVRDFPGAGMQRLDDADRSIIVSTARGGVFHAFHRHDDAVHSHVDAGLVAEFSDGRVAVSQTHDATQTVDRRASTALAPWDFTLSRPLRWVRFERVTPLKQITLHATMITVGRWARTAIRKLLQQRTISSGGASPIQFTRRLQYVYGLRGESRFTVTDVVELTDPRVQVKRLAYATDLQAAYTAAAHVYQAASLQPWTDLPHFVPQLNRERRITIVREL
jgi:hypothetical protein